MENKQPKSVFSAQTIAAAKRIDIAPAALGKCLGRENQQKGRVRNTLQPARRNCPDLTTESHRT